jgi:hypothetical protein
VRALLVLGLGFLLTSAAAPAHADRALCTRGAVHRGAAVDLDVKGADLHDVFRLLADVGRVNLVIGADVRGTVTLRVHRVAWQQVACTIAALHDLSVTVNGNILLVRRRAADQLRSGSGWPSSTNVSDAEFMQ